MWLYMINSVILCDNLRQMVVCFAVFYTMKWRKSFYALLSTTPTFLITPQTTPSICKANYSPLSSENHRSLFVKPAKRGKQRAGGEALFPFLHSIKWLGVRLQIVGISALSPSPHPLTPQRSCPTATCFEPWDNVFRAEMRINLRVNDEEDGA